ncbi:hypothetical protein X801_03051, partial [Opisthorchis viverrini]
MRYFKTIAFLLISLWMIVLMYISFGGLHSPLGHAHEVLRNRAINFAREIFFAVTASLKEINQSLANNSQVGREAVLASVESLRERVDEMTQHLEIDLDGLGRVDHLAENRKRELDRLGALVQQRLEKL